MQQVNYQTITLNKADFSPGFGIFSWPKQWDKAFRKGTGSSWITQCRRFTTGWQWETLDACWGGKVVSTHCWTLYYRTLPGLGTYDCLLHVDEMLLSWAPVIEKNLIQYLWPSSTKWATLIGVSKFRFTENYNIIQCNEHNFLQTLMQIWLLHDIPSPNFGTNILGNIHQSV